MTSDVTQLTFLSLFLPFLAALAAPMLVKRLGHNAVWILAIAPALAFVHFALMLPQVAAGGVVTGGYVWVPSFNLSFSWFIDGLSLTFALLITGIGLLIVLYAGGYMKGHPQQGRFLSFLLLFMGAMLGVVVSDSLLMLFVYWELTSITSFLLIGFDHARPAARRAALQALVVTGGGGLLLLAGLIFIWDMSGMTQLSMLVRGGDILRDSPFYLAALLLVLGGAFTKSAQFPFHFWLPNAMEAPTPVSAYLHSATMVKAGVYLLMRLNPVLGDTAAWQILLPFFGGLTMLTGALLAVRQTDLKLMLAYTTMSSLGLLVMLTGFGSDHAIEAAVLYLVAHSLFKGALFMVAGIIDHETGTRDVTKLGGLRKAMPITFAAALAAAISMAGLPPFFGFLAKEEIYYALAHGNPRAVLFTGIAILGNALMFAVAFAVALKPFLGKPVKTPKHAHEGPLLLWLGPALLAIKGLTIALFAGLSHFYISTPMASAIAGEARPVEISLIPHIGVPLGLSLLTIALGIVLYMQLSAVRGLMVRTFKALGAGPDRGFDVFIETLVKISFHVVRLIQPGRLEFYVTATFAVIAVVLLAPLFLYGEMPSMPAWPHDMKIHELTFIAIAVAGLVAVLTASSRLTAIIALGIQGFAVAVIFLLFGAPDLSFTQFMVETLSVVILTLVMTRLRLSPSDHRGPGQKLLDSTIAIACGTGFALFLMRATEASFDNRLTDFYNTYSKVIAHGANVVNVIIVDFRGTDTLGEIAVVMITGLAILALIRIRPAAAIKGPAKIAKKKGARA
ncbi:MULTISPECIES: putative monovalent cation/H+ antiporter subunit A [Rhizobium/Agrobacterium group]|jgi:multicomponent Na+:H+ antiporter subunit A|uniref:putative monovalent cation/H+ antiporter subunit A n=1 Tax=Rhizobium/Agrobacterium group TaxID=227290 RepID=UPI00023A3549|nr:MULTISPECIES: putative monovalent cation/H+ antiporter subunit A [Rhizobium/Agrobacterium group]EHJ99261.1 putative monovalent cation/H+ antiporter subunit A [Agrobacterium tumefaciens 5A]MDQ1221960.1 multicomponent Na+:H+ antiporter subunit A [Agrobacterium sp. SORGH_AS_0745]NSY42497.1 putative monovalent cation/H+ antiporter subunit A [Agrobacterium tumefaciens]NSZ83325.1 putative monovalent cation/H+ antiporter subunit A [Agrobacterium tumefaciens]WCA69546.1 putative monovalent cation/H+